MKNKVTSKCKVGGGTYLTSTRRLGFTLIELLAVVVILGVLVLVAIPTITNVMNKAKEKTFESQARMLIGAARNASIENPSKICYTLSELSNYVNKDLAGYSGSVLLDKENKVNKIWLSKNPYIINGSIEEEIEVIELEQYQEASATCEDIEILACSEDPTSYTLVINPEGGIHDGHEANEGYELTKNGTKTITEPYKVGWAFDGWEIVTGTPGSFVDELFVMGEENVVIRAKWVILYTYTGTSTFIDDGDGNWRIKFLTSGTFTSAKAMTIDVFLVGGGGGGRASGGGGGYTVTSSVAIANNDTYSIIIGAGGSAGSDGGNTTAFSQAASGGKSGINETPGGNGGSGGGGFGNYSPNISGLGGSNGSNGSNSGGYLGGIGQGTTTREFGEAFGDLYAGGGSGGIANGATGNTSGGAGGGGAYATAGLNNFGGGGGGGQYSSFSNAKAGGSGIVVIRNHR